jgi:hypothetical protein
MLHMFTIYSQVDVLVIDTEGYELPVVRGLDLLRHRPKMIIIDIPVSWGWNIIAMFGIDTVL